MLSTWELFFIYLLYGIPSVILYIFTFYVIIRHSSIFNSSFFHLYMYDGAFNLLTYFNNYIKTRLPAIACYDCVLGSIYRNIGKYFFIDFFMLTNFHMAYVQYAVTTLISLNRLSVMVKYTFFEPLWSKYMWIAIAMIYFLPFINTRVVLNYPTEIIYLNTTDTYSMTSAMPINDVFSVCIPFMIISTVVAVVANLFSITMVRVLNSQKKNKAEFNFIILTSITCAVQICGTVLSVTRLFLVGTQIATTLANFIPFVSDGLSLVQPWLLVCFSHIIREKIMKTIGLKRKIRASSILIPRSIIVN